MEAPLARSFGRAATDYELGRPEWPAAAVEALGLSPAAVVVELGAGTGKLTRRLVERAARVVCVEPLPGMRAVLEEAAPAAEILDGAAEAIPLPDASADVVAAADAFHWFDLQPTLAEIRRVLRADGMLAVLTSTLDRPTEPRVDAVAALLSAHRRPDEHPGGRFDSGAWLEAFAAPPRELAVEWEQTLGRDELAAYYASMSWVAALPEDERTALLAELRAALPEATYRRSWRAQVLLFAYASI